MHTLATVPPPQLIVLSNREPFTHDWQPDGSIAGTHSASGLVHAVEPLLQAKGGVWIAHGSGTADREMATEYDGLNVPPEDPRYRLRRVWLSADEVTGYYQGFANEALWPLCHRAHVKPMFRTTDFDTYWAVNAKFAAAVAEEADDDSPTVLVQDYHFALAPALVRERLPHAEIVAFWHIPWPEPATFATCPWAEHLLDGLLGSSGIGFQTAIDRDNFLNAVERTLECHVDWLHHTVEYAGRVISVCVYPASVCWNLSLERVPVETCRRELRELLSVPQDTLLGIGVDRMDFTKGIEEKFLAVERLLENYPALVGSFVFVQFAEPSRQMLPAYIELRRRVHETARRINERFGTTAYCPILLMEQHHPAQDVSRLMRAADVCCVSSLHDGMNLVAKEFVRERDDERGVLLLSAFAGAAAELPDAVIINPYDVEGSANALARALQMDPEDQAARLRRMRQTVERADALAWGSRMLRDAARRRTRTQRLHDNALAHGVEDDFGGVVKVELLHQVAAMRLHG
jgi:trehalose-6-phosphate synthase